MPLYENGPLTQYSAYNAGVIPNDVFGIGINWFIDRTPLLSRLPKLPVGSPQFLITNDNYRPRSVTTTAAFADTSGTVLTVADSSVFDIGDVVQVDSEYLLITAVASSTTLTVTRGYAGTSAATHSNTIPAYLVSNTRTGAEVNQLSVSRVPVATSQWCQTVQHAYSVGGALQADSNYVSAYSTPLERDKMLAIQHVMDDFEEACYYGKAVALAGAGTRPMMGGLASLITTNSITTAPTNAAAYKPTDLMRDTIQACTSNGGKPSLLLVSSDFQSGLATWGHAVMRVNAGSTVFGTPIDLFEAPFLNGINIIYAPLLRSGTAICLSLPEVRIRMKRMMIDKPRGSRGDAEEGDIIMEGAIELDNQQHHAFVTGITAFTAS